MTQISLERFVALHERLEEWTPINEARCLEAMTVDPATACVKKIWGILWDKPLFTDRSDRIAKKWKDSLESATSGTRADIDGAWRTWGNPEVFNVVRIKEGNGRSDECFKLEGEAASWIVTRGLDLPPLCRLYSIQGAAKYLRSLDDCSSGPPFRDLSKCSLSEIVPLLKEKLGWGWGEATVLHALTDMGLAVKPDRQLRRSMRELGLECEDSFEINRAARKMVYEINSRDLLGAPVTLRYLDKVLMEISRLGIIQRAD